MGSSTSSLKDYHPGQHAIFQRICSREDVDGGLTGVDSDFVARLKEELDAVCKAAKGVKDVEKRAVRVGKALSLARSSRILVEALERALSSCDFLGAAKKSDFQACVATCVTSVWSAISSSSGVLASKQCPGKEFYDLEALSSDQKDKLLYHGGWAFMRVREIVTSAPRGHSWEAASSSSNPSPLSCTKESILHFLPLLGTDGLQDDGCHLFVVKDFCLPFLVNFHNAVRDGLSVENIARHRGDAVINALSKISLDARLRKSWNDMLSKVDQHPSTASTILLQEFSQ